jgi:hypothetical protein
LLLNWQLLLLRVDWAGGQWTGSLDITVWLDDVLLGLWLRDDHVIRKWNLRADLACKIEKKNRKLISCFMLIKINEFSFLERLSSKKNCLN